MAVRGDTTWMRIVDFVRGRRQSYQLAFTSPAGQSVLIDLARFCRASETCFHEDARKHAVLEGRREVWLRIQNHLRLNSEQLVDLYGGQQFKVMQETDDGGE